MDSCDQWIPRFSGEELITEGKSRYNSIRMVMIIECEGRYLSLIYKRLQSAFDIMCHRCNRIIALRYCMGGIVSIDLKICTICPDRKEGILHH